ncbi:hypothetical protein AZI86_12060 [Bdellovibrio bacteriovorus]|uniref:Uncharacterized protein n=1 Tax=Bdellovibrio bacteriovorus TaxID=959 RepID=A0A150WM76_BDEBC|nr:hypothetical protein [Bdellovibrio bacteriovorus]KYG64925.1 hypothetical protein AZI86_12060 [Bdellovibrio bacteriovorus]
MKSVLAHGWRLAMPLLAVPLFVATVYAAGNSGSAGKPLTTHPEGAGELSRDAASMDDHTDSALNKKYDRRQTPGPRTSTTRGESMDPHGGRGAGGTSNTSDSATE